MKRTLSTLSILTLGLVMSAFAYGQTPTAACCQGKAACCEKGANCCDQGKCCDKAACCKQTPRPACCDGKDSKANPALAPKL
jgi:hypothetical protein